MNYTSNKHKIYSFIEKHELKLDAVFFLAGFIFDILFTADPDDMFSLLQQVTYLSIIASFLHFEVLYRLHRWNPNKLKLNFIAKIWKYRDFAIHFLLGSLLSVYSILYIKSASVLSSFMFLMIFLIVLIGNELKFVKSAKVSIKVSFYAICLFSFLSIITSLICGFIGVIPFFLSIFMTMTILFLQYRLLLRKKIESSLLTKVLVFPYLGVLVIFTLFYFLGWIPPIPLSVKAQGAYHKIEKINQNYILSYEPQGFKFWRDSDKEFKARQGDTVYFYAQIYSPARITDQIIIHWQTKSKKNTWVTTDKIPLLVQGGRKEGYRGYASKTNYQDGEWKITVETSSGVEISRYYFNIVKSTETSERTWSTIKR
ncbi:MAG: DUF2914 domain-containing protein [Pseudobdellovibrio sp.]